LTTTTKDGLQPGTKRWTLNKPSLPICMWG